MRLRPVVTRIFLFILLSVFFFVSWVWAVTITDQHFVYDEAGVLFQQEENLLEDALAWLWERTSAEIAIVIIDTIWDRAPFDVAMNLARNLDSEIPYTQTGPTGWVWSEKFNNWIVILVAIQERSRYIVVWTWLEWALPDALVKRYWERILVPAFRNNEYWVWLYELITTFWRVIEWEAELWEELQTQTRQRVGLIDLLLVYFFAVFFLWWIVSTWLHTKQQKRTWAVLWSALMSGLGIILAWRIALLLFVPLYILWNIVLFRSSNLQRMRPMSRMRTSSRRTRPIGWWFSWGGSSFGWWFGWFGGWSFGWWWAWGRW